MNKISIKRFIDLQCFSHKVTKQASNLVAMDEIYCNFDSPCFIRTLLTQLHGFQRQNI